jgi:hypothetical protein
MSASAPEKKRPELLEKMGPWKTPASTMVPAAFIESSGL